jgi:class 3 adenylate cyclase/tetratricopeptide (TPR) repeat protein
MHEATVAAGAALARGDLLAAHDLAASGLAGAGDPRELHYTRVLALARMGSTRAALAAYRASGLEVSPDPRHRALLGRLLKDQADKAPAPSRGRAYAAAGAAYRLVFEETADPFPGINAATLALLAGDRDSAAALAGRVLADPSLGTVGDYFAAATQAEALLLVGDPKAAAAALQRALASPGADDAARAATLRQFRRLIDALPDAAGVGERLLAPLRPPPVVTYCGHMFRPDAEAEARVRAAIDSQLDAIGTRVAYGSLACGADVLVAERLLARGSELNVVLPFDADTFIARSVAPGGAVWLPRFRACLAAASSVTCASVSGYVGDSGQFRYALLLAMGLARLRADPLAADVVQLAVWDGRASDADAGTAAEVRYWRSSGGETAIIDPGPIDRRCGQRSSRRDGATARSLRAILFADFAGFSRLEESALPAFTRDVLGRVAAVLRGHEASVCARNTWGDGIFAILDSAAAAAAVAIELHAALHRNGVAVTAKLGGMRIGLHFAPVYEAWDPVTESRTFFGREVTCAARIEPVTPVGGIYATQPFAAMLAMEAPGTFDLTYLGRIELAKGFAVMPMYLLQPKDVPAAADGE